MAHASADEHSYDMQFRLKGIESTRNRNHMPQKNPNCFPDWKDYDRALVEHVIAKSKCKPHYMAKYGNEANFCKDLEGHTNIRNEINDAITKTSEFPLLAVSLKDLPLSMTHLI